MRTIIPRPKQTLGAPLGSGPFRLNADTRIVIADGATPDDKRGAEILRKAIQTQLGLSLEIVRARAVVNRDNVIAIGEPGRSTILDRMLAVRRLAPPNRSEGYALSATQRGIVVAGRDATGTFWGCQTVVQILEPDATVAPIALLDWPTLAVRGVHLFHGRDARPFHEKLIENVLSRFKMNTLFIQAEQVRWDTDPSLAPPWAGTKDELAREIAFARSRGVTMIPLVQSHGHMEWMFASKKRLDFAEDPETPYALNVSNPAAVAFMEKINAEADALFGAPAFHVGLDEVTMRGRFPFRSLPATFSDLFIKNAIHWHNFFARRGKRMWMWADMALYKDDVAPSFGTAPTAEDAAKIRAALPKDIVMVDWQYSARPSYPSLRRLKDAGFADVVAATWNDPAGIQNFARAAAEIGALGAIQTTWAGYESNEAVLKTNQRNQFVLFVLAADYFWNGGDGPVPNALPYDADAIFTAAMAGKTPPR